MLKNNACIALVLFFSCNAYAVKHIEKPFVVIVPSYNNETRYTKNLDSICFQNYSNYRVLYVNDCSSDKTGSLVKQYIIDNKLESKVTFIDNTKRKLAMRNIYESVHSCNDSEIIVMVDGDDQLKHNDVLSYLNEQYSFKNIFLTYGNFESESTGKSANWVVPYPETIIKANEFRDKKVFTGMGHLRTFYAGLFKQIKIEDLQSDGEFFKSAYDVAILYPMIEMSGNRHLCIDKVLYIYNDNTGINDHAINKNIQNNLNEHIHTKEKYTYLFDVTWALHSLNFQEDSVHK